MAERLKELPYWATQVGRRETYPYNEWFDGEPWLLRRGVDFVQPRAQFAARIRAAAQKRHIKVLVAHKTVDDVEVIVVQRKEEEREGDDA